MLNKVYYTTFFLLFSLQLLAQDSGSELIRDQAYPQWLKSGNYRTDQTSGITFLKEDPGKKTFLLADDIGALHRLVIIDDYILKFYPIYFSKEVTEYFQDYPKLDFEEIVYDKYEEKFYLSVEGHSENYMDYVGIFEIEFSESLDTLLNFSKIRFHPEELFYQYTAWNIGYEGLTVDSRYFYLGLEGFLEGKAFSDSTVLFIADKETKEIIKSIYTSELGIGTITGLFSDEDLSIWLLDRNNLKIFHLVFNEELDVISSVSHSFEPIIPNYPDINYVGSYESITIDDEGNIYIIDDPWREFFVPPDHILFKLDEQTIENFRKHIPIIDRFQIKH
jgi:hypothetical protein